MLYQNDLQIKLSQFEIDAVKKYFHNKFPVKVVYPPERIVKSRLPHNRLPDKPKSISFDLKSIVRTDTGSEVWRYAEEMVIDNQGNKHYTPKKFKFNGTRYLDRDRIDLIFFLLKKSTHRVISEDELKQDKRLRQSIKPKFMFEDLITEADKKAEAKALESKISVLLYNKDLGLPEERIRLVAQAYRIANVDALTLSQVKIHLDNKIHDKKSGGPDKFFNMVNADTELEIRSSIQKASDLKLIVYDNQKGGWYWNIDSPEGKSRICKSSKNEDSFEVLVDLYKGDKNFEEDIKALFISKKKTQKVKTDDEEE